MLKLVSKIILTIYSFKNPIISEESAENKTEIENAIDLQDDEVLE